MTNQTTDGVGTPNLPPLPELNNAAHEAICRALDEAGVLHDVLRGMCIEVGLEKFDEALRLASPQGWKLVPMSATPEMCVAGVKRMFEDKQYSAAWEDVYSNVWRAMLAAAPEATKGNGG